MEIDKSSRHAKILGDFGESILSNWLSRSGFEVVLVDHTGIDLIAYHRVTGQRLGITVKSRSREPSKDNDSVNLFHNGKGDRSKLIEACKAFECLPWIGIYVEGENYANIYLTSLENYDAKYHRANRAVDVWRMGPRDRMAYARDSSVKNLRIVFHAKNWVWHTKEPGWKSALANSRLHPTRTSARN